MSGSYREEGGRGGGILSVFGEGWVVGREFATEFWVGSVLSFSQCTIIVINVYIPPTTSPFAPAQYPAVLEAIFEWVTMARLEVGSAAQVVICGDFNARAGTLISERAWDTTEDSRGR